MAGDSLLRRSDSALVLRAICVPCGSAGYAGVSACYSLQWVVLLLLLSMLPCVAGAVAEIQSLHVHRHSQPCRE